MRRLRILGYALSSLWRRRFKNLSILAVYTFTIDVLGSILLLTHSLRAEAFAILGDAPDLNVQRVSAGRHDLVPTAYNHRLGGKDETYTRITSIPTGMARIVAGIKKLRRK